MYVRRMGLRVVYDPRALVDHYPATRWDDDRRFAPSDRAIGNRIYNVSYVIYSLRPDLARRRRMWTILIGDRSTPGLARAVAACIQRDWKLARLLPASQRAQAEAWRAYRRSPLVMEPLAK
jgi:hypothetical protein